METSSQVTRSDFRVFEACDRENFVTGLLVYALRSSPAFATEFLNRVYKPSGVGVSHKFSVHPQYSIEIAGGSRRPDIAIEIKDASTSSWCLIEAKISHHEGLNQLKDYHDWLSLHGGPAARLVTLTRDYHVWSHAPDTSLRWRDLLPLLTVAETRANGPFERHFWRHFGLLLEEVMPTFERFSQDPIDMLKFFKELDLFLSTLIRSMNVANYQRDWRDSRASYWIPELKAGVGFWWWQGDWNASSTNNVLAVLRQGEAIPRPVRSLKEVIGESEAARRADQLPEYFDALANEVRRACTP